jgi:hypothetical protein
MTVIRLLSACLILFSLSSNAATEGMEIPFRWAPGQIEIQVSIQGRPPIWCILDSGAEFSMLDKDVGKTFKLAHERIENVTYELVQLL